MGQPKPVRGRRGCRPISKDGFYPQDPMALSIRPRVLHRKQAAAALAQVSERRYHRRGAKRPEAAFTFSRNARPRGTRRSASAFCWRPVGMAPPFSRAEAEMLFDIDAAATERTDQGRFDDLFCEGGRALCARSRRSAGAAAPLLRLRRRPRSQPGALLQPSGNIDTEILLWIASHV